MMAATSSPEPGRSGVIGNASADEPPATLPAEPSSITPAGKPQAGQDKPADNGPPKKRPVTEEPDLVLEPDLPSDGRDEVGEAMIRDLPQRPELSEPPSQPELSEPPSQPDSVQR